MEKNTEDEYVKVWNIAYKHISNNPKVYAKISFELQQQIHLALLALQLDHTNYEFIPENLKLNEHISKKAINLSINNFSFLPKKLQFNQPFILDCLIENKSLINVLTKDILTDSFANQIAKISPEMKSLVQNKILRLKNKT